MVRPVEENSTTGHLVYGENIETVKVTGLGTPTVGGGQSYSWLSGGKS